MAIVRTRRRRRGSATVEYALFLALIAGGIILAADSVNYAMRSSFDDASLALEAGVALRHLPVEDLEVDRGDVVASLLAPSADSHVQGYQFAAVAGMLFIGAVVWYALYCRHEPPVIKKARDLTEQLNNLPPELSHDELFEKRQQILRMLSTDVSALLDSKLEVRHLMSRRVLIVTPDTKRAELDKQMKEHRLRHLLVCGDDGGLIGVVSDRDLHRKGETAGQLMTTDVIAVEAGALVNPATTMLINKRISCLPVVADGAPVGVVTSTDLMMALQCAMQILQKAVCATNGSVGALRGAKSISAISAPSN